MSGSDRDSKSRQPQNEAAADDPWAKWRKPEAPAAVDAEKVPKTEPVVEAKAKPTGTLGVIKRALKPSAPTAKKTAKGGTRPTPPTKAVPAARKPLAPQPIRPEIGRAHV